MKKKELLIKDEIKPKKIMVVGFHHHGIVASLKSLPEFKINPGKFLNENQEHKLTRKERREQQRKKP